MLHREYLNHFGPKRNLNILDSLEYKLTKFFVKEIKVDGLLECTAGFVKMMLSVLLHVSKITSDTEIADIAKL